VSSAPEAGHIVWLNFDPQAGREQAGRRPALVLSSQEYNAKIGLMIVCPITSRIKGYPFEVALPEGLGVHGVVLADQVKSIDWRVRDAQLGERAPESVLQEVLGLISALLRL
jgi:mRNA interferase MazF